jgi:hypothetical protein
MKLRLTLALVSLLLLGADTPDGTRLRPLLPGLPDPPPFPTSTSQPDIFMSVGQQTPKEPASLGPQTRLEIIRYVSGEFAKAVKPLPGGARGFKIEVGKKLDDKELTNAIRSHGAAASPGDTVQITALEFRAKEILVLINGGGRKKFHLREHLQVGIGGATTPPPNPDPNNTGGSTLILDYGARVPDMSADDLMHDLEAVLDFSKRRSAAVNWVDTLPPQFKQAIQDHEALLGMDHEMVLAALGRPDHKVRERDPEGKETEDWIYGNPPSRTTFVTFAGDKVVRVKKFG